MFLTFAHYPQNNKTALLLVSAGCFCLGVLSYPSFLVGFPIMLVLLWKYCPHRNRELLIYSGVCAGIGSIYGRYFLFRIGWDTIADCLSGALAVEPTHTVGFSEKVSALLSQRERTVYDCALWIGIANLTATLLLSDHGFLQAVPYMLIAVCSSVLPLYRWYESLSGEQSIHKMYTAAVHLLLLLIMFRSIYWHIPISGRGQICTLLSDMAFIRTGPAAGIFTDELGAAMQRDSYYDWNSFVEEGDTIWILGDPVDTLGYLYMNTEVGAPTVMSTPTYNEELLRYWELNPDKYPNVIMLSSNYEEISWDLLKNNWLIDWLGEEYMANEIEIGTYWVFLRKD